LCRDKGGLSVLSILKADNKGYPWANQVALPGGHVDRSDESPKMAAFREVKEELNIDEENIEYIGDMGYFLTINNTQIQVFTGIWNGMDTLEVDSSEIAEVLHIPVAELLASHIDKGFSGVIPGFGDLRYPHGRLEVWGATARIFHYFIERLFFDDLKVY
jgi:8-oxo-dGTP pyrophosphatase MutT (NUDIX family)